uniref:Aminopeptidase n=1 Tax=Kalanchoe fedtschenkoi TaxID=63787 RepID=A0A7N0VB99_KALFE
MATEHQASRWEQFRGHLRLPNFAVPRRYDLRLKPDLVALNFSGTVKIDVHVVAETSFLVLNAADLNITAGSVRFRNSHEVLEPVEVRMLPEDEYLVLDFGMNLPMGMGALEIGFRGILNDEMKGFYRGTYEVSGVKKNMAVTQFESIHARRCFPCWDEPALKAVFKITMDVPSELTCLSNMPVYEEKVYGHSKSLYFQESPIMSTYLVAFVIGLFDYVEDYTTDGIKVRVYCPVGRSKEGTYALDVALRTLQFYRIYFAVPYALPKLDMVAIHDFQGAMENYGLITFQDIALLYDSQKSGDSRKQHVAHIVTHELGHQWCGDLVTMEWWKHLWLNEGFATWLSHLATDNLFPTWKTWNLFIGEYASTLRRDTFQSSHPVEVEIDSLSEIAEIFDSIIYIKGASILRMLHTYLGGKVFQRSLALYIKKYAWSNAKTEDLWDVFETVSGRPVKHIMTPELLDCTKEFLTTILQNSAQWLGWLPRPGESDLETAMRVKVLTALAVFGHRYTLKEARRRFHSFLNNRQTPLFPTAIRQAAYVAVMQTAKTSSRQEYNSLKSLLHETNESSEKLIILSSLLSCPDPGIVSEVLEYIIHSENKAMIPGLSVSWGAREAAWTWLKHNWDYLLKTFQSKIGTFVSETVKLYASVEKAKEIKEFFANRTIPSIVKSINQSIDQIYVNVKWAESIQHDKRKLVKVFRSCHSTSIKPLRASPV